MSAGVRYLIIGGGLAGAQAAQTLREEGATGPITVIGDEADLPYLRPPLSKEYLQGNATRDSVFIHDSDWYAHHDIDLQLGVKADALQPGVHSVRLTDGRHLPYDRLLLATGSTANALPMPGADLDGVMRLRRLGDSDRLKQALSEGQRMVVIGAGWIGLEVAAAARIAGLHVTVVEIDDYPLQKVLGRELGAVFADLHVHHGVHLRTGVGVETIAGQSGRVTAVQLDDGTSLPADVVVVGVGARPNSELADEAGMSVDNGIVVDEFLQTSAPDVFAAGDVANAFHRHYERHIRVEHWDNAQRQGSAAALNMLGRRAEYDRLPFFYSDQYDLGLEYTGHVPPGEFDRVVIRGAVESYEFIAFWLAGEQVIAAMSVNTWDVRNDLEALIHSRTAVDAEALADPDTELPVHARA